MPEPVTSESITRAARVLAGARHIVVFTGAGVSAESGIATFREPETGLWAQYDPMDLATREGFLRDPELVWRWYEHRFGLAAEAEPNPGHHAIAELERLIPGTTVVTQNIDGLHQRAGSSDVVELHGTMHSFKCLDGRHRGYALADLLRQAARPPRCPECGDHMRPDVVWFGEALPDDALRRAQGLAAGCDVMLVAGTSAIVYPAAGVPLIALQGGAVLIDVNPEPSALSHQATHFLQGRSGDVLPRLVTAVEATLGARRPDACGDARPQEARGDPPAPDAAADDASAAAASATAPADG
ncbi:MAG TPA: NAD-dependent deacylase [Thermoleophilia bacterium]|nr:NAD-dependent deacylase [Thermoleophilia bacterium]